MRSYETKIKNIKEKLSKKLIKQAELEKECKRIQKEYFELCSSEIRRKFKIGDFLVYKTNYPYGENETRYFIYYGIDKEVVQPNKYIITEDGGIKIDFGVCNSFDYKGLRLGTKEEKDFFLTKLKEFGIDIEYYG